MAFDRVCPAFHVHPVAAMLLQYFVRDNGLGGSRDTPQDDHIEDAGLGLPVRHVTPALYRVGQIKAVSRAAKTSLMSLEEFSSAMEVTIWIAPPQSRLRFRRGA